jgi:cyclopropane fatty-acyl-phospholipid synthase-like methyltransferase
VTELLRHPRYPRTAKYDAQWIIENGMGSNPLWYMESLSQVMTFTPGMRVLDMGCGKAISSVFLAKEFGVQVWATDVGNVTGGPDFVRNWANAVDPTLNWKRICEAGVGHLVYPVAAEAHALPYADGFFDAIVSVNSYWFFGTGDFYFHNYFLRLVKPGGQIGMVVPGVVDEMTGEIPEHLKPHWDADFYGWHSPGWWRRHWSRTGLVDVEVADALDGEDGWRLMERWQEAIDRVGLARDDRGRCIRFVRVVARRRE